MYTGRIVRGVFQRVASLATNGGAKSLLKMAPKVKMDVSSITTGRILGNSRVNNIRPKWLGPTTSAIRHMTTIGAFGSTPTTGSKYMTGGAFYAFAKTSGLQSNHLATDGLGLALHKGRHTNLI